MEGILVPICICVVLPVLIVLIVNLTSINSDNKRSEVLIKAIEANNNIDADKLATAFQKPQKTAREIHNLRLLRGCICAFIGLGLCIVGITSYCISGCFETEPFAIMPSLIGCVLLAVGLSYFVVYFVTRKQIKD